MAVTACRFFIRPFPVLLHELCVYGSSFFTSVSFSYWFYSEKASRKKGYKGIFRPFQQRKRCFCIFWTLVFQNDIQSRRHRSTRFLEGEKKNVALILQAQIKIKKTASRSHA